MFGFLRGVFLYFLKSLLVILILLAVVTNVVQNTFFSPDFYTTQLEKVNGYDLFRDFLIDKFTDTVISQISTQDGITEELKEMIKVEMRDELANVITVNWIKSKADNLIRDVIFYLRGESEELSLVVHIEDIKPSLGDALENAFMEIAESQGLPVEVEEVRSELERTVNEEILGEVPDSIDINEMSQGEVKKSLMEVKEFVSVFFLISTYSIIGLIVVSVLIIILDLRFKEILKNIGWPSVVAGALILLEVFLAPILMEKMIQMEELSMGDTMEKEVGKEILVKLVQNMFNTYIDNLKFWGFLVIGIGVIFVVGSIFVKEKVKEKKK